MMIRRRELVLGMMIGRIDGGAEWEGGKGGGLGWGTRVGRVGGGIGGGGWWIDGGGDIILVRLHRFGGKMRKMTSLGRSRCHAEGGKVGGGGGGEGMDRMKRSAGNGLAKQLTRRGLAGTGWRYLLSCGLDSRRVSGLVRRTGDDGLGSMCSYGVEKARCVDETGGTARDGREGGVWSLAAGWKGYSLLRMVLTGPIQWKS